MFDEVSFPAGLHRERRAEAGAWGVIRVLEGRSCYEVIDRRSELTLGPNLPGAGSPPFSTAPRLDSRRAIRLAQVNDHSGRSKTKRAVTGFGVVAVFT